MPSQPWAPSLRLNSGECEPVHPQPRLVGAPGQLARRGTPAPRRSRRSSCSPVEPRRPVPEGGTSAPAARTRRPSRCSSAVPSRTPRPRRAGAGCKSPRSCSRVTPMAPWTSWAMRVGQPRRPAGGRLGQAADRTGSSSKRAAAAIDGQRRALGLLGHLHDQVLHRLKAVDGLAELVAFAGVGRRSSPPPGQRPGHERGPASAPRANSTVEGEPGGGGRRPSAASSRDGSRRRRPGARRPGCDLP